MYDYLKLLKKFVKFQSVSTTTGFAGELKATVDWLAKTIKEHDFKVKIKKRYGNPIIIAHYTVDPAAETALIYGHYDVQPASKEEGWDSNPFSLTEKNGRLIARGAVDNKGQIMLHLANIFTLIKEEKLRYNLVLMIEGNEESGSPKLLDFVKEYKDQLKADFALISDGELNDDHATIEAGYRGGFNCTLTVSTSHTDLHSGIYGGVAPSAAHELTTLLAKLYNTDNEITIDGFYEAVDLVADEVKRAHARRGFDLPRFQKITGTKALKNERGIDPYSQVGLRPSVQVTGISSGFFGDGYKNSIPATATAKLNFRLVKSQSPKMVMKQFKSWVERNLLPHSDFKLEFGDSHEGIKLDLANKYVLRAKVMLEKAYGEKPRVVYVGGGLPIVTFIAEELKQPCVMIPLANEDCAMHSANENFKLSFIKKGLRFCRLFFGK